MTTQPNATEIQRFFEMLYPDVEDGWLVLSHPDPTRLTRQGKPVLLSDWFELSKTTWQKIAQAGQRLAQKYSVYFGVALQRATCDPGQSKRSKNATAYIVPGLWFDLDLAYGQHAASTLPATDADALEFLGSLPAQPSLLVHSGGGMYGYWLFREPYIITNNTAHEAIVQLSRQFTHTLVTAGKTRGWTLDGLGDLARVLRPPGTINHKYGKPVELLRESGIRYNPSEFDWLLELATPAKATHAGAALAGQPDLVGIVEHYGTTLERKSTTELAGAHPQHGSSTGDNCNVNVDKGLWHCWRHGTGGDALALITVCEGLVPCEEMRAGALHGDLFKLVVGLANHKFQAGITLGGPRLNVNGHAPQPSAAQPQDDPGDDTLHASEAFIASAPWPEIREEAFYGLAGRIIHTIAPHTEADPIAILIQFLTMFGNLVGRTPYFPVEADRHSLNLFVCLVGETSKGRKGVSAGYPKRLLETVDDVWAKSRMMSGLSSGEGLIWYVRDAT